MCQHRTGAIAVRASARPEFLPPCNSRYFNYHRSPWCILRTRTRGITPCHILFSLTSSLAIANAMVSTAGFRSRVWWRVRVEFRARGFFGPWVVKVRGERENARLEVQRKGLNLAVPRSYRNYHCPPSFLCLSLTLLSLPFTRVDGRVKSGSPRPAVCCSFPLRSCFWCLLLLLLI